MKRQAMLELQKAVSAAEQKASDMISSERIKMEQALKDGRKQAHTEILSTINHQEESSEVSYICYLGFDWLLVMLSVL